MSSSTLADTAKFIASLYRSKIEAVILSVGVESWDFQCSACRTLVSELEVIEHGRLPDLLQNSFDTRWHTHAIELAICDVFDLVCKEYFAKLN